MSRRLGRWALAVLLICHGASAAAEPSLRVTVLGLFETGPTKFVLAPGLHVRDVYHRDPNPLLDRLHLDAGVELLGNPATPGGRLVLEWIPVAPLVLRATHTVFVYSGAPLGLGHGLSFLSSDSDFSAAALKARTGEEESEIVQRPSATVVLRLKLSRLIALNEAEIAGWYVPAGEGAWWYEALYDLLVARGQLDATLMNRTVALVEAWRSPSGASVAAGLVHEYARAFRAGLWRDRAGAALMIGLGERRWGIVAPTAVIMGGVTLAHPSRAGQPWMQLVLSTALSQ